MKISSFLLSIALITFSFSVHADEGCLVSTDVRALMSGQPGLKAEKILTDTGRYTAVLENGDSLVAQFSTCGLGKSVHYFSVRKLSGNDLKTLVKNLMVMILSSETAVKKILPQLDSFASGGFNQPVVLEGLVDQHEITVKSSPATTFGMVIQYSWIPPEH